MEKLDHEKLLQAKEDFFFFFFFFFLCFVIVCFKKNALCLQVASSLASENNELRVALSSVRSELRSAQMHDTDAQKAQRSFDDSLMVSKQKFPEKFFFFFFNFFFFFSFFFLKRLRMRLWKRSFFLSATGLMMPQTS